jgi:hypothetical protein
MIGTLVLVLIWFCAAHVLPVSRAAAAARPDPQHEAPPATADEVVFRPSDKRYERKPQVVQGRPQSPDHDFIDVTWTTVAEVAQVYADFSRKEVRVPRGLTERTLSTAGGKGSMAFRYVIYALDTQLPYDGVDIVPLGRGVVGFRAGKTFAEQIAAARPPDATPQEVAAARAAMTDERFWSLLEKARAAGRGDCFKTAAALQRSLEALSTGEILGFGLRFHDRLRESYRWDLWGVAYLVNGGASDDGFEYFRAWLIGQGHEYYAAALKDPERAAERAGRRQDNECEQLLYCAMQAYEKKTGRAMPMMPHEPGAAPAKPAGTAWKEEDLPRLFPNVARKFR